MTQTIAPTLSRSITADSRVGLDLLGPAYCISLADKPERRSLCRRQFRAEGLSVSFIDAIVPNEQARFPTRGAHGCFQSHLSVLESAMSSQPVARYITIFEDDVLLPRTFSQIVKAVMRQLRGLNWHILYWGTENQPPVTPVRGREPLAIIAPEQPIIGKQAYTIRLDSVPALIEHLHESRQRERPGYSDGMYHEFRMRHKLPAYTHTLRPARQASFASNITPRSASWARQPLRAIKRTVQMLTR